MMVLLVCGLGVVRAAGAQRVPLSLLETGSDVQVKAPVRLAREVRAVFVAAIADTVRLYLRDSGAFVELARSEITQMRRRVGRSTSYGFATGRKWGAIVGGGYGLVSALSTDLVGDLDGPSGVDAVAAVLVWTSANAIAGVVVGGVLGSVIRRTRWQVVDLSRTVGVLAPRTPAVVLHRVGLQFTW
jgi:hypothetical protein